MGAVSSCSLLALGDLRKTGLSLGPESQPGGPSMTSKEWFPLETKAMGSAFKATFPGMGTEHLGMGWLGLD